YFDMGLGTFNWKYRDIKVSVLTDNVAIISGYHDMYEDPPSEIAPYTLLLRFTKVLQKIDGKWLIIHNNETRVETGSPTRTDVSPTS
ncbi:MAG: nuclear transport factor 2 family protein, partial [Deltaproteobacteria bacterium]|nr:nuclear transport factor 2 family protein [Deltaproteobacteria bacterium]